MGIQVENLTNNKTDFEKSFIDFSFDEKYISEFGMVAVFDGDRHSFAASPEFENETTDVKGVAGQHYWGTKYKTFKRSFSLATDGMTEAQINEFKIHFQPGRYGRFIESKLAGRYGYGRVSSVVNFTMVPFKKEIKIKGQTVAINEYKGECRIVFEFDTPYLYSINEEGYIDSNKENLSTNLQIAYQNNIPIIDGEKTSQTDIVHYIIGYGKAITTEETVKETNNIITDGGSFTYYNPSNIDTPAKLVLEMKPVFNTESWPIYFSEIADDINGAGGSIPYNRIIINKSINNNHLYYTSPNIIYSINKVIKLANNFQEDGLIKDLENKIRLEITHAAVASWAMKVLGIMSGKGYVENGQFNKDEKIKVSLNFIDNSKDEEEGLNWKQYFNIFMLCLLGKNNSSDDFHIEKAGWSFEDAEYIITIDGEQCSSSIEYNYNKITDKLENITNQEKSCGDMILSSYLKLDGGDCLDLESGEPASCHIGKILKGEHSISQDSSIQLIYKYMYI